MLVRRSLCRNRSQCDSMRFNAYHSCQGATHAVVDATCEADSVVVQSSASASAAAYAMLCRPKQLCDAACLQREPVMVEATKQLRLAHVPPVLTLHLKRFAQTSQGSPQLNPSNAVPQAVLGFGFHRMPSGPFGFGVDQSLLSSCGSGPARHWPGRLGCEHI